MRRSIWEKIREILKKHVLHGKWVRSVIALACIVTFITTYLLIMPAVTLSRGRRLRTGGAYPYRRLL